MDSAYRSQRNEKWLAKDMMTSHIHRRKPSGKPMPKATARANVKKSWVCAYVEHVFAHQKNRYGLFIRTIGLARAEAKPTLANLAYNFDRLIFHLRRKATAQFRLKSGQKGRNSGDHAIKTAIADAYQRQARNSLSQQ